MIVRVITWLLLCALVDDSLRGRRNDFSGAIFPAAGAGEGIQADFVGVAVLILARGEYTEGLAGEATPLQRSCADVDLGMANEAGGLAPDAGVIGDDVSDYGA